MFLWASLHAREIAKLLIFFSSVFEHLVLRNVVWTFCIEKSNGIIIKYHDIDWLYFVLFDTKNITVEDFYVKGYLISNKNSMHIWICGTEKRGKSPLHY